MSDSANVFGEISELLQKGKAKDIVDEKTGTATLKLASEEEIALTSARNSTSVTMPLSSFIVPRST